jgi:hypothetical protein
MTVKIYKQVYYLCLRFLVIPLFQKEKSFYRHKPVEPESSLPCSQEPITGSNPESVESSLHPGSLFI